jgi:TQXA domain-containing protein
MASRTSLVRVGAAVLGVSAALMIGVLPASAGTGATATVVGSDGTGTMVTMDKSPAEGGGSVNTSGVLNKIQIVRDGVTDKSTVDTYCMDLTTSLVRHVTMQAGDWASFNGRDGSTFHEYNKQINWILQNSYPSVTDLAKLSTTAGLPDTISTADAISGTQAAVWHFSDGANLETQGQSADLVDLYKYLIGSANTGIDEGTLSVSPDTATGTIGKLVGPFTVHTNLTGLGLDVSKLPSGVNVVNSKGTQLTGSELANGSKFYLQVPAGATATSGSVSVSGDTPSGMIFTADHSQDLIAAGTTPVVTQVSASWSAAATTTPTTPAAAGTTPGQGGGGLAYTGVSATGPIVLGALLVAAGGLFLLVQRRLKRAA